MFRKKVNYKIYTWLRKIWLRFSYIDTNASIGEKTSIEKSEIHGKVTIQEKCKIHQTIISGNVKIGRYTTLWGPNIQVLAGNSQISIGNFCSIARDVTIQGYFHDYSKLTTYYVGRNILKKPIENEILTKGDIEIGNDVWIGTGVQIMSGIKIGNGAVIGANSTVTKDVPPFAIVGGVPAKIIRYRFEEDTIQKIEKLKWWEWSVKEIKKRGELFELKGQDLIDKL